MRHCSGQLCGQGELSRTVGTGVGRDWRRHSDANPAVRFGHQTDMPAELRPLMLEGASPQDQPGIALWFARPHLFQHLPSQRTSYAGGATAHNLPISSARYGEFSAVPVRNSLNTSLAAFVQPSTASAGHLVVTGHSLPVLLQHKKCRAAFGFSSHLCRSPKINRPAPVEWFGMH